MDVLKDCVFAMKRLSDYTAGIIDPYKQSTIRQATESFGHWTARVQEKRDRDINTLIESLFFFINSEQERSKDAKRLDWIETQFGLDDMGEKIFMWPDSYVSREESTTATLRELIDTTIEQEIARTTPESSESQTQLRLETDPDSSKREPSESSPSESGRRERPRS